VSITARQSVGDDPADEGERDARDREGGEYRTHRRIAVVYRKNCKGERHGHECIADPGGDAPEPEQPKRPLRERSQCSSETHAQQPNSQLKSAPSLRLGDVRT
jgi:hypothetical protein